MSRLSLVLALMSFGCSTEPAGLAGGVGPVDAARYPFALSADGDLHAGVATDIVVTGGEPGVKVGLWVGRGLGAGSCPRVLDGACLEITRSSRVGIQTFDGAGQARFSFTPSLRATNGTLLQFQAGSGVDGGSLSAPVGLRIRPYDYDGDGFLNNQDCDDLDNTVYPGAPETPWDGTDQDCDGFDSAAGTVPLSELAPGELVITEFLNDPSASADATGEWFELENRSALDVDLGGMQLSDDGTDSHTLTGSVVVLAGERVVLGRSVDPGANGGAPVDFAYGFYTLGNSGDEIILSYDGVVLASVAYTTGGAWADPSGASHTLDPSWAGDPADPAGWCVSVTPFGLGDRGTPGAENEVCVPDNDGDGVRADLDCDDDESSVYPGAPEIPGDGIDQDCDGEDAPLDFDADGFVAAEDCDDSDAGVYPGAPEVAGDGIDQNCDGADLPAGVLVVDELIEGDLVITEFLQNPFVVVDTAGEWFEVFNNSGSEVELSGLVVSDLGIESFVVTGSLRVLPGDYVVLGANADVGVNGGAPVDYAWSGFTLGNSDDEIVLSNAFGLIDSVAWDGGPLFPDPNGASSNLDAASIDATLNDSGGVWCEATAVFGLGDLGTPGAPNGSCGALPVDGDGDGALSDVDCDDGDDSIYPGAPEVLGDGIDQDCDGVDASATPVSALVPGDLIITEIMQNPNVISDANGEWFEVYNASGGDVDVLGLIISDAFGSTTVGVSHIVPAGGFVLFGVSVDPLLNGGLDIVWDTGSVTLSNSDDTITIANGVGALDFVGYDGGPLFPDPAGASMSLDPTAWDIVSNDVGANWCLGTGLYEANNSGTPGAPNPSCF